MSPRVGRQRAFVAVVVAGLAGACTSQVPLLSSVSPAADADVPEPDAALSPDAGLPPDARPPRETGPEASCSEFTEAVRLEFQAPEVVIALDRSFSMFGHKPGAKSWWQRAKEELSSYMRANEGAIQFGYEEFPGRAVCDAMSGCCGSRVLVPPYLNSHSEVEHQWKCDNQASCYETTMESPSGDALERIRTFYDNEPDPSSDRFVLLVTDGAPSCASDPDECDNAGRQAARLFSMGGIKTMVLGIGDDTKSSQCLDAVAFMGQTRQPGPTSYAWTADPDDLADQLAKAMVPLEQRTCRFLVRGDVKDLNKLEISVNFMSLPRDTTHRDGWDLDASGSPEIQLYGSACKQLKCNQLEHRAVRAEITCTQCGSRVTCP
jgi:hypothetical protein